MPITIRKNVEMFLDLRSILLYFAAHLFFTIFSK